MGFGTTSRSEIAVPPNKSPAPQGKLEELLAKADIRVPGPRPLDMQLHRAGVLERIASRGGLAIGESYVAGDWDAGRLDEFFAHVLRARLDREVKPPGILLLVLRDRLLNRQNTQRAWQVGEIHYNPGNDFYQAMPGPVMAHAAEHYGVECVGVTVSKEQAAFCRQRHAGLPLEFHLEDYRNLRGRFDRIASIGMFEHVGEKNHRTFMEVAHRCLADDGIFLLHIIGKNERRGVTDPWIEKYILPNAQLPSIGQIGDAADGLFVTEDLHNFGADYDRTLMEWHRNFEASWPRFAGSMGERFHRQWRYYLLSCAGAFRARDMQVWQWVLTKNGRDGGCPRFFEFIGPPLKPS